MEIIYQGKSYKVEIKTSTLDDNCIEYTLISYNGLLHELLDNETYYPKSKALIRNHSLDSFVLNHTYNLVVRDVDYRLCFLLDIEGGCYKDYIKAFEIKNIK